jgi:Family of unknown function (DUF5706)
MRAILESILTRISEQQKYAEGKNAIIATVSGAIAMALITAFSIRNVSQNPGFSILYLVSAGCLLVCTAIALSAFLPFLSNVVSPTSTNTQDNNLLFFEHIKGLTEDQYLSDLNNAQVENLPTVGSRLEKDLANQIIVNSIIIARKHAFFKRACYAMLIGITILVAGIIAELYQNWHAGTISILKWLGI